MAVAPHPWEKSGSRKSGWRHRCSRRSCMPPAWKSSTRRGSPLHPADDGSLAPGPVRAGLGTGQAAGEVVAVALPRGLVGNAAGPFGPCLVNEARGIAAIEPDLGLALVPLGLEDAVAGLAPVVDSHGAEIDRDAGVQRPGPTRAVVLPQSGRGQKAEGGNQAQGHAPLNT